MLRGSKTGEWVDVPTTQMQYDRNQWANNSKITLTVRT